MKGWCTTTADTSVDIVKAPTVACGKIASGPFIHTYACFACSWTHDSSDRGAAWGQQPSWHD